MKLTITQPDDMHLHVRDGDALEAVIGHTARQFARAIIMPNLKPPVTSVDLADAYRKRILAALPDKSDFQPLMTLYLTDNTSVAEIASAANSDFVHAIKYYPAGATTNSDSGVTDLGYTWPALEAMQKHGLPLLIHGEVTDPEIDIFDREAVFIERHLSPLVEQFPALKIVFEHLTTSQAVQFVESAPDTVAATITAHHLLFNRNVMLAGGIRPHYYCLPILKREQHRRALLAAATSGNPKFFAGTDSAPHPVDAKQSACGCAGIYSAHAAMEFYAQAFEQANALNRLEGFCSFSGADFYGLPRNTRTLSLEKTPQQIPASYSMGKTSLVPLCASESIPWQCRL